MSEYFNNIIYGVHSFVTGLKVTWGHFINKKDQLYEKINNLSQKAINHKQNLLLLSNLIWELYPENLKAND